MVRNTLVALFALALVACDGGSTAGPFSPTQPDGLEDGKSDGLARDIEKLAAAEALRSATLKAKICDAARSASDRQVMEGSCDDQTFDITAFYGNTSVIKDGEPLLVAMDIEFQSDLGYVMRTKLVRQIDFTSHGFVWVGRHVETVDSPDIAPEVVEFEEIVADSGTSPKDFNDWDDRFVDMPVAEMPSNVGLSAEAEMQAYTEEFPDEFIDVTGSWRITGADPAVTLGYAVRIEATIENGEVGWVYYFDASGEDFDEFDWST